MKARIINRLVTLCALSACLGTAFVQIALGTTPTPCCLTLPTTYPANRIDIYITINQPSYPQLVFTVASAPAGITLGQNVGWCAEHGKPIDVSNSGDPAHYFGQPFSSCDPN